MQSPLPSFIRISISKYFNSIVKYEKNIICHLTRHLRSDKTAGRHYKKKWMEGFTGKI